MRRCLLLFTALGVAFLGLGSSPVEAKNACLFAHALQSGVKIDGRVAYIPPTDFAACGLPVPARAVVADPTTVG